MVSHDCQQQVRVRAVVLNRVYSFPMETKITKLKTELKAIIAATKKTMDSNINTIQRGLLDKIEALNTRVTNLEEESKKLKEE